jgi:hypothetical protein
MARVLGYLLGASVAASLLAGLIVSMVVGASAQHNAAASLALFIGFAFTHAVPISIVAGLPLSLFLARWFDTASVRAIILGGLVLSVTYACLSLRPFGFLDPLASTSEFVDVLSSLLVAFPAGGALGLLVWGGALMIRAKAGPRRTSGAPL